MKKIEVGRKVRIVDSNCSPLPVGTETFIIDVLETREKGRKIFVTEGDWLFTSKCVEFI